MQTESNDTKQMTIESAAPAGFPFRFQKSHANATQKPTQTPAQPTPVRRPRGGRLLVAAGLVMIFGGVVYGIWSSFFQFSAYGVVTGNIVEVSSAIDAPVRFLHADEGEKVVQGQTLATQTDLELEQQLERIHDDLRIAEATLHAEIGQLRWKFDTQAMESQRAVSEYSKTLSDLERETAELRQRDTVLQRRRAIGNAASPAELENAIVAEDGQRRHVEALRNSLKDLKARADVAQRLTKPGDEQIGPAIAKITALLNELKRVEERLQQRFVSSPVNGTVLRRHRSVGEFSQRAEPVYSILESGSMQIMLLVRQEEASTMKIGRQLYLHIDSYDAPVLCEVVRLGDEMISPPRVVEVFYPARQTLMPVYVRPVSTSDQQPVVRVGSVVRMARNWN